MKQHIRLASLAVITLALAACSSTTSTPPLGETTRSTTHTEGVPGGIVVETYRLNATVKAVDTTTRKLTLTTSDGRTKTATCGPEVINFDQIKVGDQVNAMVTAELALAIAGEGELPMDAGVAQVALAPKGDKPGGVMTETQQYTATVTALNLRRREVTLRLPDDTTRTFTVRPDIDLSQRKVGDKVAVRVTVAVAISVETP